jgi:hypothetical protein
MRRTTLLALALLAVAGALGATAWLHHRATRPVDLSLVFHPVVGAEPLVFDEARYPNPGGEGRFAVRDFQFFLSNVRLTGGEGSYAEPDSYHLVRFDGADGTFVIVLRDVPRRAYERIELGIGVDAAANGSVAQRGELDPNGRMAWTWEVGYKFVLLEGTLVRGETRVPLVYHVGFDESYRVVTSALPGALLDGPGARLDFQVDVLRLFAGPATIDMAALPTVKLDRADAALLAGNHGAMIAPLPRDAVAGPAGRSLSEKP